MESNFTYLYTGRFSVSSSLELLNALRSLVHFPARGHCRQVQSNFVPFKTFIFCSCTFWLLIKQSKKCLLFLCLVLGWLKSAGWPFSREDGHELGQSKDKM